MVSWLGESPPCLGKFLWILIVYESMCQVWTMVLVGNFVSLYRASEIRLKMVSWLGESPGYLGNFLLILIVYYYMRVCAKFESWS